jgi:hypothetical protein
MIRKLTLAVLVIAPVLALAASRSQKPGPGAAASGASDAVADDASFRAGEPDLAPESLEGAPREGDAGPGAVPPPDTYTVRPGDTLWDLSGRFLNNPWYWPKIWSYNPEITNPHWIYPGNLLRFYQSGEEAPGQVTPVNPDVVAEEEGEAEPVRELEDLSRIDMARPASDEEKEAVAVAGPYKIGYVAPRTAYASHDAFVTPRELEESGSIRAAFEEKTLLSARDRAYATFRSTGAIKVGETYAIYRTVRKVKHPVTGEMIGYQSIILGSAKVVALDAKAATISIAASYEPIERGDMLGPWTQKSYRPVPAKPNARSLQGYIVSSPVEILTQLAEHHVVFVDKGKADGVEEGNRLVVVRSGDPRVEKSSLPTWDGTLPVEEVGALLVVDVKEHASAALVTRSLSELAPGDRVEMRVAGK